MLLNIKEYDRCPGAKKHGGRTTIKYVVGLNGALDALRNGIAQISDLDGLCGLVKDCESITSDKESGCPTSSAPFARRIPYFARAHILRESDEFVQTIIGRLFIDYTIFTMSASVPGFVLEALSG